MWSNIRSLSVLAVVIMTSACNKELSVDHRSDNSSTGGGGTGTTPTAAFRMKIDGKVWAADKASSVSMLMGFTNITGLSKTNKLLNITLSDTVAKTYRLSSTSLDYATLADSADAAGEFSTNSGADSSQSGGRVVVTSVDRVKNTVSGTFQFKLYRASDKKQVVITEGVFDKLPYSASLPPASSADTMKAKINNAGWSAVSVSAVGAQGFISIIGTNTAVTQGLSLVLPATIKPGNYTFDNMTISASYLAGVTNAFQAQSGTLTILEHNTTTKRIRGSFSFTGRDVLTGSQTATVSEGYFSLTYH